MLDTKRLLDQFLGGQQQDQNQFGQPAQSQNPLGDLARNAGGMLSGNLGGIGGGAVAGGLVAVLLGSKSARKMAGNVMSRPMAAWPRSAR